MNAFKDSVATMRATPSLVVAAIGMGMLLTSASSYRLNVLVGIYVVDLSLIVRHGLAALVALTAVLQIGRAVKAGRMHRSGTLVGVAAVLSAAFSVCILAKYSANLLVVSNDAVALVGRVCEEAVSVALLLLWAQLVLGEGIAAAMAVYGGAVCIMGLLQLLLSVFQHVPCMFALALFPLGAFGCMVLCVRRGTPVAPPTWDVGEGYNWPMSLHPPRDLFKFLGALICFGFVVGLLLYPSLEIQQFNVSMQLSIALGNLVAGAIILAVPGLLAEVRRQPRLALALVFLSVFALLAIALSLHAYLNEVTVTLYLMMASVVWRLLNCLVWLACFSRLGPAMTRQRMFALGLGTLCLSRVCSTSVVAFGPTGAVLGAPTLVALMLAFVLSILAVFCAPGPVAVQAERPEESEDEADHTRPFKRAVQEVAQRHGLTNQESNVLFYVAKGNNARRIGEILTLSPNTVKSHMRTLYAKLGVHTQQEAIDAVFEVYRPLKGQGF